MLGRVSIVAALEHNGDYLLAVHPDFQEKIEKLPIPISSNIYYLLFSHQFYARQKALTEKIWDILAETREKYYQLILFNYIKRDFAQALVEQNGNRAH